MIRVTPEEALELIKSLSCQLITGSPNTDRLESYSDKGEYLSIAVHIPRRKK